MEDGERVPIVIEQPPGQAAGEELRADGTLVIDIKAEPEPCAPNEGQETGRDEDEIVVCAELKDAAEAETGARNPLEIQLGENATLAPTAGSVGGSMGGSGVEAKVTLRVVF